MTPETDIRSVAATARATSPPANHRRGPARRGVVRGLAWGALGVAIAAGLLFSGWRYGLKPPPPPVAGIHFEKTHLPGWGAIGPENSWYWARELDRFLQAAQTENSQKVQRLHRITANPWAVPDPTPDDAESLLAGFPELDQFLAGVLASADNQPPARLGGAEIRAMLLLTRLPLVEAAARERDGQAIAALEHLLTAWQLQALLVPHAEFPGLFDERGLGELDHQLWQPWRRITSRGPGLSAVEGRRLLNRLTAITNSLPDTSRSYRRIVTAWLASAQPMRGPDWSRVRRAFSQAATLSMQEVAQIGPVLWSSLSGYRVNFTHMEGAGHFGRPFKLLWESLQRSVLRSSDLDAAIQGATSQMIDRFQGLEPTANANFAPGFWQRWLDRPALWRTVRALPDGTVLRRSRQHWLAGFESCRLALALRVFREEQGDWPESLAQLSPRILPELPADPRSGGPFGYARTRTGWRLWSSEPEPAGAAGLRSAQGIERLDFPATSD